MERDERRARGGGWGGGAGSFNGDNPPGTLRVVFDQGLGSRRLVHQAHYARSSTRGRAVGQAPLNAGVLHPAHGAGCCTRGRVCSTRGRVIHQLHNEGVGLL